MLKTIELSGFKSFAKNSNLNFTAPIVAVVGPNGSGKSNTAEAFRFVLGEQSMKSLRSKRGEDLIWGGSDLIPRSNRASVRITFDNTKRLLDVDFDDVILERAVHRDGTNEYFINGSRVRLKDITALLSGANIGSTGHHIISQGEADRILNASTKERREMIEDALGLKIFQNKKVESERKLERTLENMETVEGNQRELVPHLRFLERQMKKRERASEIKKELIEKYAAYLSQENFYIKNETKKLEDIKNGPLKDLQDIEQKIEIERKKASQESPEPSSFNTKISSIDGNIEKSKLKLNTQTRELGSAEGQISFIRHQIRQAENQPKKDIANIPYDIVKILTKEILTESAVAEKSHDTEILRGSLRHIHKITSSFTKKIKSESPTQPNQKDKSQTQLTKLEEQKIILETNLTETQKEVYDLEKERQNILSQIETEKNASQDNEKKLLEMLAQRSDLRAKVQIIERDETSLTQVKRAFEEQVREGVVLVGRYINKFQDIQALSEISREEQEATRREIERMKIKLEEIGIVGDEVIEEYNTTMERKVFLDTELQDLEHSRESLFAIIKNLEDELGERFKQGIEKINTEFNNFFILLFGGGDAELTIAKQKKRKKITDDLTEDSTEEEEETEDGIAISVKLPRKKKVALEVLSGGERALTSIALIFAMSQVNPPPFIILDETDAALDEANSKRYADMVRALSEKSQLILITHNRETMASAGELYGVTMGNDGVSKLLSVKLQEAFAVAK